MALGFSGSPSPIAGITPAPEMLKILDEGASAQATAARVPLDQGTRARITAATGVPRAEVGGSLRRLPLPLSVSGGLLPEHRLELSQAAADRGLPFVFTAGSSAAPQLNATATLDPGTASRPRSPTAT